MRVPFQRSVFIGLGGTGQLAVLHLKKRLLEVYGEIPPVFSLLCFDTDRAYSPSGENPGLGPAEFMQLRISDPRAYLQSSEVTPWWSTYTRMKQIDKGFRIVGRQAARLALFANAPEVRRNIGAAIDRVRAAPVGELGERFTVLDEAVSVHVVSSIAGSAGAGTFLDIGMVARSLLTELDRVTAHLLLPDAFIELPGVFGAERVAYACLQEIDLLMGMTTSDDYSYVMGGQVVPVHQPPFNTVHLIGDANSGGTRHADVRALSKLLGTALYLEGTATSVARLAARDSMYCWCPDPWEGRELNYSSYGVAECFFDRVRSADLLGKRIARGLAAQLTNVTSSAEVAYSVLGAAIERMRTPQAASPFVVRLEPPGVPDGELDVPVDDFLGWLDTSAGLTLAELAEFDSESLIDLLGRYAAQQPLVRDMLATSVTDVITYMEAEGAVRFFNDLRAMAAPSWLYDRGFMSGARRTELMTVIAFPDHDSLMSDEQARRAVGASERDLLVSTGDPDRVSVLTTEALLPAFVIENVARYRDAYLAVEPRERAQYHLDRTWVKDLVDLMPRHSSERSDLWAVACAMHAIKGDAEIPYGAVNRRGNVYYFITRNAPPEKNHEMKLGQGRLAAYEAFLDTPEYVAEVEQQLQEELQRRGTVEIAEAITSYAEEFEAQLVALRVVNAEVQALTQQELTDLASLVEDILTIK